MRSCHIPTRLVSSLILSVAVFTIAYSQTVTTRVSGTVKDQSEAVVAGATVKLIDAASRDEKTTRTNDQGTFTFTDVRVGNYIVTAEASGFKKTEIRDVQAHVDVPVVLNLLLE